MVDSLDASFAATEDGGAIEEIFCRGRLRSSEILLIAFSGLGTHAQRPYDFPGLVDRTDSSVLLVRDLSDTWFQAAPGLDGGVAGLAAWLAGHAQSHRRVICLGFSMGGYAALLFGRLLNAESVLAFAPQSVLTAEGLAGLGDPRWADRLAAARERCASPAHLDLARLYDEAGAAPRVSICIPARSDRLDRAHAQHMAAHAKVVELGDGRVDHAGFGVWLRQSGALRRLIDAEVAGRAVDLDGVQARYGAWLDSLAHELTLDPPDLWPRDAERVRVTGRITKTGAGVLQVTGGLGGPVRVGARLTPDGGEPAWPIEWRHDFAGSNLAAGEVHAFHFDIRACDLPAGRNRLSVSLVKEADFWFRDLGLPEVVVEL